MGLNAFFTFTICLSARVPWPSALGLVFWEGFLFLVLTLTGVRQKIVEAIPASLKTAIGCGIGLFIAFIGLKKRRHHRPAPETFVTLGNLSQPAPLLVLFGILLTAVLIVRRVPGAIILVVLVLTVAGLFLPATVGKDGVKAAITTMPKTFFSAPASLGPTFFKLDFGYLFQHPGKAVPLLLTLLFVDLFDNVGHAAGSVQTRRVARRTREFAAHRPRPDRRRGRGDVRRVPGHVHHDELH